MQQQQGRRDIRPRPDHAVFETLIADNAEARVREGHYFCASALNMKRWILPVAVFGNSLRNSIQRGYLYGASLALTMLLQRAGERVVCLVRSFEHDKGARLCELLLVVPADDGRFQHVRMRGERRLHLEGRDIHARYFQHIVGAAAADVIAVLVLDVFVAGTRPLALEGRRATSRGCSNT